MSYVIRAGGELQWSTQTRCTVCGDHLIGNRQNDRAFRDLYFRTALDDAIGAETQVTAILCRDCNSKVEGTSLDLDDVEEMRRTVRGPKERFRINRLKGVA